MVRIQGCVPHLNERLLVVSEPVHLVCPGLHEAMMLLGQGQEHFSPGGVPRTQVD
jgi:hypothetical protein